MRSELYAEDHHWGDAPIDLHAHDLPALKARYLVDALPTSGRVLEIGCGGGRLLHTIAAAKPALELHGCDIRPLRGRPTASRSRLVDPDAPALPYEGESFDAVVMYDVLEHLLDPAAMIEHAARHAARRRRADLVHSARSPAVLDVSRVPPPRARRPVRAHQGARPGLQRGEPPRDRRTSLHASPTTSTPITCSASCMDATLFAAIEIPALRARFWDSNPFYAEGEPARCSTSTTVGNR